MMTKATVTTQSKKKPAKPASTKAAKADPKKAPAPAISKGTASKNDGLLDAILATPDDDAPRLVYADYLTNLNDVRGEFILMQCMLGNAIGGAGKYSSDPTKQVDNSDTLVQRAQTLAKKFHGSWLGGVRLDSVTWTRGFPREGACDAIQFVENSAYDRIPLEGISLIHWNGKAAEAMFGRTAHPTIRRFWFGSGFGPKMLHVLGAPVFARAKRFEAGFWQETAIPPKTLTALAQWKFPDLEELDAPIPMLAAFDHVECPRLRMVEISESLGSIDEIRTTGLWRRVKHLRAYWRHYESLISEDDKPDFSALKDARSLETLSGLRPTDEVVQPLIASAPPSLKTIEGSFGELGDSARKALEKRFVLSE